MSFLIPLVGCSSGREGESVSGNGTDTITESVENSSMRSDSSNKAPAITTRGCVQGDCENGYGVFIYSTGDTYSGNFQGGKRNGNGVFQYKNGDKFSGNYKDDLRNGPGKYTYSNGDIYEGDFSAGGPAGAGIYTFNDGKQFYGEFSQEGASGKGQLMNRENCEINDRTIYCP